MRLFAALVLSQTVSDHLAGALAPVVPPGAKWLVPKENWHVTLAFYGEVPDGAVPGLSAELGQVVEQFASQSTPPSLHLSGAGTFRGQVAWIGLGGQTDPLGILMRQLAEVWPTERPAPIRPHLTIGRGSRRRPLPGEARGLITALSVYRGPDFLADEVTLMLSELKQGRSGRSRYTPVESFPLESSGLTAV